MRNWKNVFQSKLGLTGLVVAIYVPLNHLFSVSQMIDWVRDNIYRVPEAAAIIEKWALVHPIQFDLVLMFAVLCLLWAGMRPWNSSSPFELQLLESSAPYFECAGNTPGHGVNQLYRIRVKNNQNKPIGGVTVTLQNLIPQPNALYGYSVPLRFSNTGREASFPAVPQPMVFIERQNEFVDVISYKQSNELPTSAYQLHIEHAWKNEGQRVPHDDFTFVIQVSGNGVEPLRKQFRAGFHGGKLYLTHTKKDAIGERILSYLRTTYEAIRS
jgi:hypothetical protein